MDDLRAELEQIQKQLAELQAKQTDELDKERQQRISELNQRREILEIKVESGAVSMGDGSRAYGAGATHIEGGVHHHHYPPQPQGFSFDWQQSPAHSFLLTTFLMPRLASEHPTDTKWAYVLGESPEKAVDRFLARKLLERCSETERVDFQLARLGEERLTELLAKYNLPTADDKAIKIKQLLAVDSWALLAEIGPVELLRCTPLGREKAQAYLQNGGRILETVQDEPTRQMVPELLKWLAVAGVGAVIGSQLDDLFAQLLPQGIEFAPAPENPAASERRSYRMNTRQRQLLERMSDKRYSLKERAEAGQQLAKIGDPRPEVIDVDAMEFCYVPAGDFYMGEDGKPLRRETFLNYDYYLGRYPVTNAQFQTFVDEGGYRNGRYWQEAQRAEVWQRGRVRDWGSSQEWRTQPYDFGEPKNLSNHPVLIHWYEALAFSKWLTERWRRLGWLGRQLQVLLPSEAEWEKAARGGLYSPLQPLVSGVQKITWKPDNLMVADNYPRRDTPWGGRIDDTIANYNNKLGSTNTVGLFQDNISPYGCIEMSGNVWEWTRSLHKDYPYRPRDGRERLQRNRTDTTVLRGGGYWLSESWCRCGSRDWPYPLDWLNSYGVRLVVVPVSLSAAL